MGFLCILLLGVWGWSIRAMAAATQCPPPLVRCDGGGTVEPVPEIIVTAPSLWTDWYSFHMNAQYEIWGMSSAERVAFIAAPDQAIIAAMLAAGHDAPTNQEIDIRQEYAQDVEELQNATDEVKQQVDQFAYTHSSDIAAAAAIAGISVTTIAAVVAAPPVGVYVPAQVWATGGSLGISSIVLAQWVCDE